MSNTHVTIRLPLTPAEVRELRGRDLLLIAATPAERRGLVIAMATLERFIEAHGDADEIAAFQAVGTLLARGKWAGDLRLEKKGGDL